MHLDKSINDFIFLWFIACCHSITILVHQLILITMHQYKTAITRCQHRGLKWEEVEECLLWWFNLRLLYSLWHQWWSVIWWCWGPLWLPWVFISVWCWGWRRLRRSLISIWCQQWMLRWRLIIDQIIYDINNCWRLYEEN